MRKEPSPEHEQTEDGEEPENKNTEESSKIPESKCMYNGIYKCLQNQTVLYEK